MHLEKTYTAKVDTLCSFATPQHFAGIGKQTAGDDVDKGRFAGTVGS